MQFGLEEVGIAEVEFQSVIFLFLLVILLDDVVIQIRVVVNDASGSLLS